MFPGLLNGLFVLEMMIKLCIGGKRCAFNLLVFQLCTVSPIMSGHSVKAKSLDVLEMLLGEFYGGLFKLMCDHWHTDT